MISIIKRDGTSVPFDVEKLHVVLERACEGLQGVSVSEVIDKSKIQFTDGMKTERIHEIVMAASAELISVEKPNYQYVAARLKSYDLRKRAYGQYKPPHLRDIFLKNISIGKYDAEFMDIYTEADFDDLQATINHKRDKNFTFAAMSQLTEKYLLRDRTKKGSYCETPQVMYMAIAMALFSSWDHTQRLEMVKKFYNYASTGKFSLPTPIMAGVRTRTRQFSSCVLIKSGDTLDSITATGTAIVKYVSKRAGIGVDFGAIRALGSSIRDGEMTHTGTIPFIKKFVGDLKSCSQGGIRGGSATMYYPMWHFQFDDMIVLKNNRGIENNRERRTDYGVQINGVLWDRLIDKQPMYLFDPKDVGTEGSPFYESFYADNEQFKIEYEAAIQRAERGEIRFKKHSSEEIWQMFLDQRSDTGRIYAAFVDNMNRYSPFTHDTIYQSNLCAEIALPTKSFQNENDATGRIALCTLASLNMTGVTFEEMEDVCFTLVSALDSLLEYQDYPMMQAREAVLDYRPLGIGIVNLAHFLAKNFCSYGSTEGNKLVDEWMAHLHYNLVKASNRLAQKFGKCRMPTIHDQGKITADLQPLAHDLLPEGQLPEGMAYGLDWDSLKADLKKYGIRNATLLAIAPTESSSQVLNATNGVEPPKGLASQKGSKDGMFTQLVPDVELLGPVYDLKWDTRCADYLSTVVVVQRWVDQSISTNTHYDPNRFPGGKIPRSVMMQDMLDFYARGGKTLYYNTNRDTQENKEEDEVKVSSGPVADDYVCESCII
ncbi:ribonucleotide reductase of class Ia (aerobic) alpha subunit [Erwinia phage phiEa2809]|uniref:Ribonucleoside-diphosphate reductase n=1 Tax=Erwinia phage phiEa2809 TaxID=1564096 RepID=A0A0A0YXE8_9CAUD|nr:NrdA-like aerobic NDP reductase large subunit [Erwinia phage phiEa2809]AIX13068.1 ribonucleotide reductase of class Ia (aerobic) alpha subunit [Erwinia phage phiEa2809]